MSGRTVIAKTRKRCPGCSKMVEVGDAAVLTDDRFTVLARAAWLGKTYQRGAWHLYHPACRDEFDAYQAAAPVTLGTRTWT